MAPNTTGSRSSGRKASSSSLLSLNWTKRGPEGTSLLVRYLDFLGGTDEAWTERNMFGWRRAILELDQIRSLAMMKVNAELNRVSLADEALSTMVRSRLQVAMVALNRDVDSYVSKKVLVAGTDAMDQLVTDATVKRLHFHIELAKAALVLLGCDDVSNDLFCATSATRALLFLTTVHVAKATQPTPTASIAVTTTMPPPPPPGKKKKHSHRDNTAESKAKRRHRHRGGRGHQGSPPAPAGGDHHDVVVPSRCHHQRKQQHQRADEPLDELRKKKRASRKRASRKRASRKRASRKRAPRRALVAAAGLGDGVNE